MIAGYLASSPLPVGVAEGVLILSWAWQGDVERVKLSRKEIVPIIGQLLHLRRGEPEVGA